MQANEPKGDRKMYTLKQNNHSSRRVGLAESQSGDRLNCSEYPNHDSEALQGKSTNKTEYKTIICKQLGLLQILANSAGYQRMAILFEELQFALASPRDAKGLANLLLQKEG